MQKAKKTESQTPPTGTDWERLRRMTDADIRRAVAADPDAAPIRSAEYIKQNYKPVIPKGYKPKT
jgi:hypothetical protein